MKKLVMLLTLLAFTVPAYGTTIYKWVGKDGTVNFTDDHNKVPSSYRDRVEVRDYLTQGLAPPYSEVSAQKKGETQADPYGRAYWERRLDEATLNYEKAREELLQEGERLVWHRYGGKTQYQMFTEALPSMSERSEDFKEQMNEAKDMLEKFTESSGSTEALSEKGTISSQTDIYGRDERWWKEKMQPWKEQLKEAREGYENASEAFIQQLERLGPSRWGGLSLTQYQFISTKLTLLNGQMMRFQSQISEARGMLAKLFREAMETKADPAWFE